ncbi:hypothetical protein S245_048589, partial [Arachis hypogaea]
MPSSHQWTPPPPSHQYGSAPSSYYQTPPLPPHPPMIGSVSLPPPPYMHGAVPPSHPAHRIPPTASHPAVHPRPARHVLLD